MNKASSFLVTLLIVLGCFGLQHSAFAQTEEQASEQSNDQAEDQAEDQAGDQTAYMLSNDPPTVTLTAKLHPSIIEDVWFLGLQAVPESIVLKEFQKQHVGIGKKYLYSAANFEKGVKLIKEMLEARNYPNATVDVGIDENSDGTKIVKFLVTEGAPIFVKGIQFVGNRAFTGDELRSQLKLASTIGRDVFDRNLLLDDLQNVCNFMRSKGYLKAKTAEPTYQLLDGGFNITVPVEEELLYRVGEIKVQGSERFSHEQIVELIGLKSGDTANARILSEVLNEESKSLYYNLGYPQFSAKIENSFKTNPNVGNEGIVNVYITIEEGACFKIGSIELHDYKKVKAEELRRLLLFKEGDTYNRQLIEDSVKGMNESGFLRAIGFEAKFYFRIDDEAGLVVVVIEIRELQDY